MPLISLIVQASNMNIVSIYIFEKCKNKLAGAKKNHHYV